MIDIQLLRKDPEAVAKRLATRGLGVLDVTQFQGFEDARKKLQTAVEQAQALMNKLAKEIGQAKKNGIDAGELIAQGEKLKAALAQSREGLEKLQVGLHDFLARIPNLPHESVPVGTSCAGSLHSTAGPPTPTRTVFSLPMRPLRTSSTAVRKRLPNSLRCWLPTWKMIFAFATSSTIQRPSATLCVSGFSQ
jgi:seryl-tRNA synthetase